MTILNPSSKTCCSIVWRTFAAAIGFSALLFGVRFRVEGVSARTGAILIVDRTLRRQCGQRVGRLTSIAKVVQVNRRYLLYHALTQQLVFPGEQILHEIV